MASLEIDRDHSPDAAVASPGGELYRDCASVWSTIPLICPGKRNFSVCRSEAGWKLTRELGKGGRGKVGREKRREGTGVSESISEASRKWPAVY